MYLYDGKGFYVKNEEIEPMDFDLEIMVVLKKCVEHALEVRKQILDDVERFLLKEEVEELKKGSRKGGRKGGK